MVSMHAASAMANRQARDGTNSQAVSQSNPPQTDSCASCPLLKQTLYGILEPKELDKLRGSPPVRIVTPRTMLHRAGEVPGEVYSVRSGWAFRFILLPDGRRQILSFYLPGDLISFENLFGRPLWFAVQAMSQMTLCIFDRNALAERIWQDRALLQRSEDYCIRHVASADRRLVDIGKRKAIERVAMLILDLAKRFAKRGGIDSNGSFPFLMRQEHIADALGLTRVHVSRTFSMLRRNDAISIEGDRLTICDRALLIKFSGIPEDVSGRELDGFIP